MIAGEVLAPKALIVPSNTTQQNISGALWISGAALLFFPYDGSAAQQLVTSAAA